MTCGVGPIWRLAFPGVSDISIRNHSSLSAGVTGVGIHTVLPIQLAYKTIKENLAAKIFLFLRNLTLFSAYANRFLVSRYALGR
jgi:hypothetical protein